MLRNIKQWKMIMAVRAKSYNENVLISVHIFPAGLTRKTRRKSVGRMEMTLLIGLMLIVHMTE